MKTKQIVLNDRPSGMPKEENFKLVESDLPSLQEGQLLVKSLFISVDPYMRGRMNDAKSYVPPYQVGGLIDGGAVCEVVESASPDWKQGDIVLTQSGWQTYAVIPAETAMKIDPELAPISTALGTIGMPGLTAYFGLLDIGKPQEGETVVVSGAAGAVGSVVGQIAKIKGAKVIGIAGSDEKNAYLKEELGFDEVINYKTENVFEAIQKACPNGVDVYFDNVGGDITDAVLLQINQGARIVLCGQISMYNLEDPEVGPRLLVKLVQNSALMQGFIVTNYMHRFGEGFKQLGQWVAEGKIKYRENIVEGFEHTPQAFLGLFSGENIGKQLVQV
ncbi:NADP-dependent oxidoreductase [Longirhabdus pacifica]|uniref:NADP-dependent oxidoreductase n=1 Tax=Longirhabdus pacifica TaxID=2305227 RepID=UPI00100910A2|nr:NADP-dependent oxidoreductase [Longirhabdus pacifica]